MRRRSRVRRDLRNDLPCYRRLVSDGADYPGAPPARRGVARRTARAALRRVDAMFSRNGPAFRQLAVSWAANVGGDTMVTVALAGTLFFSVPSSEARGNVALYLGLTLAPFTILAPVLGGVFARFRGVYRAVLTLSSAFRTVLALVMMLGLTTIWLYPLAFGMLVLSRLFGIAKSSLLPVALPQPVALVAANAFLARIGILAGAVVLPLGAAAEQIDPAVALAVAAGFFLVSTVPSGGLPNPRRMGEVDPDPRRAAYVGAPRSLRLSPAPPARGGPPPTPG